MFGDQFRLFQLKDAKITVVTQVFFQARLNRDTLLEARSGKRLRALDIFSKALKYLKDRALERIHEQSGVEYKAKEVRWVVTVPAIWKQSAKQFMREAAYEVQALKLLLCLSVGHFFATE